MSLMNMTFLPKLCLKEKLKDESGLAIVEFCLMLPLVIIIMLFLIIVYEFSSQQVAVQEKIRYEMRQEIDRHAAGNFQGDSSRESLFVNIPGRMKNVLGRPFIKQSMTLHFYRGCYHDLGKNYYRKKRHVIRLVEP